MADTVDPLTWLPRAIDGSVMSMAGVIREISVAARSKDYIELGRQLDEVPRLRDKLISYMDAFDRETRNAAEKGATFKRA